MSFSYWWLEPNTPNIFRANLYPIRKSEIMCTFMLSMLLLSQQKKQKEKKQDTFKKIVKHVKFQIYHLLIINIQIMSSVLVIYTSNNNFDRLQPTTKIIETTFFINFYQKFCLSIDNVFCSLHFVCQNPIFFTKTV